MKNQFVTGIGCFASPQKLSRVFLKMVQNYTLGQLGRTELADVCESGATEGAELLKALIAGKATCQYSSDPDAAAKLENKKITGFFLTLRNQRLNLSIFAKGDQDSLERYTASLDGLTAIRQKRLN